MFRRLPNTPLKPSKNGLRLGTDNPSECPSPDNIKRQIGECRQITHIALHCTDSDLVMSGGSLITGEHFIGKIEDGPSCAEKPERSRLLAAACRETEHSLTREIAQQPVWVYTTVRCRLAQVRPWS